MSGIQCIENEEGSRESRLQMSANRKKEDHKEHMIHKLESTVLVVNHLSIRIMRIRADCLLLQPCEKAPIEQFHCIVRKERRPVDRPILSCHF